MLVALNLASSAPKEQMKQSVKNEKGEGIEPAMGVDGES